MATTQQTQVFKPSSVLRYPRLDTVLMIEAAIRKAKDYPTKAQLLRSLPKKVMYQTFNLTLAYLEHCNKIHIGKDGRIVWIWDPELVRKYLKKPELLWNRDER